MMDWVDVAITEAQRALVTIEAQQKRIRELEALLERYRDQVQELLAELEVYVDRAFMEFEESGAEAPKGGEG